MSSLTIRRVPDPILKQPTRAARQFDAAFHKFVDAMIAVMRSQTRCVGLAANQVGSSHRVAVMDASVNPKAGPNRGLIVLVNPVLVHSEGSSIQREGCLSIPDFTGNVRRAQRVTVEALDRYGEPFALALEGFEAIIAQHEIDHLEGRLFLDRVTNLATDVFRRRSY